jgi:RNA polymerase sigma-70 factor (ECF subfamily)
MSAMTARENVGVELARSGDREAFMELVARHDEGLRALAFRMLGDRDRMDDALQEAYTRAFRGLARFRGDSSLATWLYRIVYNVCVEELRRSRRLRLVELDDAVEHGTAADVGDEVALRTGLEDALAALAPEDRAAVLLVDAQGFDYRSAAEILRTREGTIASRLNRARAVLRQALEDDPEGDAGR